MSKVLLINKGENKVISDHLKSSELDCKCTYGDCTYTMINEQLLIKWMILRARMAQPLHINSAFRCKRHNKDVGSTSKDSRHVRGSALDIALVGGSEKTMISFAEDIFPFVKVYDTFIHCDVREL